MVVVVVVARLAMTACSLASRIRPLTFHGTQPEVIRAM